MTDSNIANSNEIDNSTISTPSIAENSNDFDGFLDETPSIGFLDENPSIGENQNTSIENILSKSKIDDGLESMAENSNDFDGFLDETPSIG